MLNKDIRVCPKCNTKHLVFINGCGWDYDSWVCMNRSCDYVKELDVSTMPDEVHDDSTARAT